MFSKQHLWSLACVFAICATTALAAFFAGYVSGIGALACTGIATVSAFFGLVEHDLSNSRMRWVASIVAAIAAVGCAIIWIEAFGPFNTITRGATVEIREAAVKGLVFSVIFHLGLSILMGRGIMRTFIERDHRLGAKLTTA